MVNLQERDKILQRWVRKGPNHTLEVTSPPSSLSLSLFILLLSNNQSLQAFIMSFFFFVFSLFILLLSNNQSLQAFIMSLFFFVFFLWAFPPSNPKIPSPLIPSIIQLQHCLFIMSPPNNTPHIFRLLKANPNQLSIYLPLDTNGLKCISSSSPIFIILSPFSSLHPYLNLYWVAKSSFYLQLFSTIELWGRSHELFLLNISVPKLDGLILFLYVWWCEMIELWTYLYNQIYFSKTQLYTQIPRWRN